MGPGFSSKGCSLDQLSTSLLFSSIPTNRPGVGQGERPESGQDALGGTMVANKDLVQHSSQHGDRVQEVQVDFFTYVKVDLIT